MREVHQEAAPHQLRGHDRRIRDHVVDLEKPRLVQVGNAVHPHANEAQIRYALVPQGLHERFGNGADPDLQGGPGRQQRKDVIGDRPAHFVRLGARVLRHGRPGLNRDVDLGNMDGAFPARARERLVQLGHDQGRVPYRGEWIAHRRAEVAEAVAVRRSYADEGDIGAEVTNEPRNL